jgi:hypothetical protein
LHESYFDVLKPAAERANASVGPNMVIGQTNGSCVNYCPMSNAENGALLCALNSEDHCPMNGYWHTNMNKPGEPSSDSTIADFSFSVFK